MRYRKRALSICLAASLMLMSFPAKSYAVEAGMSAEAETGQETQSVLEEGAEETENIDDPGTESSEEGLLETEVVTEESTQEMSGSDTESLTETAQEETAEAETAETEGTVTEETVTEETETAEETEIIGFLELPDEVQFQRVPVGTPLEKLSLPAELEATDREGEAVTLTNIAWKSNPEFDENTDGEYLFSPTIPETYKLEDEGKLPLITVIVEKVAAMTGKLTEVHLDPEAGDDANDGTSRENAVKTLERAGELIGDLGTIFLHSTIYCKGKQEWVMWGDKIERGPDLDGPMVWLEKDADVTIHGATFDGGGADRGKNESIIYSQDPCKLTLSMCRLQNNYSDAMGSAIAGWNEMELAIEDNTLIAENVTDAYGTVFLANGSHCTIGYGDIRNNVAKRGGGVAIFSSEVVMEDGYIESNEVHQEQWKGCGGGIYITDYENISGKHGESITAGEASFTMKGGYSSISNNYVEDTGGGILAVSQEGKNVTVNIEGGTIKYNSGSDRGGGIALIGAESSLNLTGGSVSQNWSMTGGGIYLDGTKNIRITGGSISENDAGGHGGGIAALGDTHMEMSGGEVKENTAGEKGGGIYTVGTLELSGGKIFDNSSDRHIGEMTQTCGNGIYVGNDGYHDVEWKGRLRLSGDAQFGQGNDVAIEMMDEYRTDAEENCYISIAEGFRGASDVAPIEITSVHGMHDRTSAMVEPRFIPGTRLVVFEEKAGGSSGAWEASQKGIFVPSAAMLESNPRLHIGQSAGEKTWLTYKEEGWGGRLTVYKTVTGTDGEKNRDFHFQVILSDPDVNGAYGAMDFQNGIAQFTLRDGEQRHAVGLPEGITYRVEEEEAGTDGYTTSATDESGVIVAADTVVVFENHRDIKEEPETPSESETPTESESSSESETPTESESPSESETSDHSETEDEQNPVIPIPSVQNPAQPMMPVAPISEEPRIEESHENASETENPQTGDGSAPVLWAVLAGISAAGLAAALMMGKRKKR